mgnify:CR=1 FL=1
MEIKNSFLADAINTLAELGKKAAEPTKVDINGRRFMVTGGSCTEIEPLELPKPEKVNTRSLNALVVLIKSEVARPRIRRSTFPAIPTAAWRFLPRRTPRTTCTAGSPTTQQPATSRRWLRMCVGASTKR